MALKECGLAFWADSMASRNSASRSIVRDNKDEAEPEEPREGRVVESLGHVCVENKWCLFVPTGSFPPARAKHAALSIGRRMFVLGGASAGGVLDDVQVFHGERGVWLQLGCGREPSLYSPSRSIPVDARGPRCVGHCLAFWETKLLVIGGRIEPKSKKIRAFALDLESQSWSVLAPEGDVPTARTGQSVVQIGSSLILFGGEDSRGQVLNDLYMLDLKTLVWLPLKTSGSKPSPRRGHSAACYTERYMLIYGGKGNGNYYNDVYILDLQNMEWSKERIKGTMPSPRAGHAGAMVGSKWYIIGGECKGGEVLNTMAFDVESGNWQVITTVQPGTPLANEGISLVKVRNKGKMYLLAFGGHGTVLSNQIFVMMISSANKTIPPVLSKIDDRELHDDFSASSLPFSFTSGSLQAALVHVAQEPQRKNDARLLVHNCCPAELEQASPAPSQSSDGDSFQMHSENKQQHELAEALARALKEKQEIAKRLDEALSLIEELRAERTLVGTQPKHQKNTSEGGSSSRSEGKDNDDDLQEQLRDSQQQIVFAVRKQAAAERKLLGALRENRELRKKLLHAVQD